ncbi:conserved protein of unknown function [Rhodovastum atsumiense]|uniref:Uncharacterized protein n=1 Tax=Rhodovastum atsumiense TaxID=504468 RepID=A0A5M6IQS3_9PROT|nr:hypothetical protein [Rhodovastum atsumiense]KAA5610626.1 hypothetical protein F1189_18565 [Rhodovastum atsumiense]CAH2600747.1 conserved protein of unknown function [Rhodovastum atsumiense]
MDFRGLPSKGESLLLACATMLATTVTLVGASKAVTGPHQAAARVGQIIVFERPAQAKADGFTYADLPVRARVPSGNEVARASCVLEPQTLAAERGSLLVHGYEPNDAQGSYRVHWEGGRTSFSAEDCGPSVDLTVSRRELDQLTAASWELRHPETAQALHDKQWATVAGLQ